MLVHGTGTQQNDSMESKMIAEVFHPARRDGTPDPSLVGQRALWVSGIKGKLGHQGGAAAAFQALTAVLVNLQPAAEAAGAVRGQARLSGIEYGGELILELLHV